MPALCSCYLSLPTRSMDVIELNAEEKDSKKRRKCEVNEQKEVRQREEKA